jgi:hypothetical protein
MPEPLRQENFAPHVGKSFRFAGWHGALRLAKIDALSDSAVPGTERMPFTLIFHGPSGDVLPEGLHEAEIEDGPMIEFYISPIHTVARDRQDYQAVFN